MICRLVLFTFSFSILISPISGQKLKSVKGYIQHYKGKDGIAGAEVRELKSTGVVETGQDGVFNIKNPDGFEVGGEVELLIIKNGYQTHQKRYVIPKNGNVGQIFLEDELENKITLYVTEKGEGYNPIAGVHIKSNHGDHLVTNNAGMATLNIKPRFTGRNSPSIRLVFQKKGYQEFKSKDIYYHSQNQNMDFTLLRKNHFPPPEKRVDLSKKVVNDYKGKIKVNGGGLAEMVCLQFQSPNISVMISKLTNDQVDIQESRFGFAYKAKLIREDGKIYFQIPEQTFGNSTMFGKGMKGSSYHGYFSEKEQKVYLAYSIRDPSGMTCSFKVDSKIQQ